MKVAGQKLALELEGWRLHIWAPRQELLECVAAELGPSCIASESTADPDWTVRIEEDARPGGAEKDEIVRPELTYPQGGPRLTVLDNQGCVRVRGHYRPDSAASVMEADPSTLTTRLVLPTGDADAVRWCDWLAKVFFASRLLATGWRMLHASAVAVNHRAVLFLAGQRGGKSTLAHRACTERGAAFLADDLVLLGPEGTVMGWPTRVRLPVELLVPNGVGTAFDRVVDGQARRRLVLTPVEHRTELGITYSPPVSLGSVVSVVLADRSEAAGVQASYMDHDHLASAVAEALEVPRQRLFTSDLLGLTGGPRTTDAADAATDVVNLLAQLRGAVLRMGDSAALSTAPVWDALSGLIPELAGAR